MQKPFVTVGVDGSVYRFHPTFPILLDKKLEELLEGDNLKVSSSNKKLNSSNLVQNHVVRRWIW